MIEKPNPELVAIALDRVDNYHDSSSQEAFADRYILRQQVRYLEGEIERLTFIEQATKTYITICDGTESARVVMAAFDDLKEAEDAT